MIDETLQIMQILSAAAAAGGLVYAARAFRQQARSIDLQGLASLLNELSLAEERLALCKDDPQAFQRAFIHYANRLEVMATAWNNGLFGPVSARVARNRLVEDLAIFQSHSGALQLLESSLDGPATYSDLRIFISRNRKDYDRAVARRTTAAEL